MRTFLCSMLALLFWLPAPAASAQGAYFPKNALSDDSWSDHFKAAWYSRVLTCLNEPSLLELGKERNREVYRFLWIRSFHRAVAVRFEVRTDQTGMLTTKVANGEGGFLQTITHLIEDVSRPLSREQTRAFLSELERTGFWSLHGGPLDQVGADGAQWIIEGVRKGKYHVVDRWSPKTGPIRELGLMFLFGMAQMNIPGDQVY